MIFGNLICPFLSCQKEKCLLLPDSSCNGYVVNFFQPPPPTGSGQHYKKHFECQFSCWLVEWFYILSSTLYIPTCIHTDTNIYFFIYRYISFYILQQRRNRSRLDRDAERQQDFEREDSPIGSPPIVEIKKNNDSSSDSTSPSPPPLNKSHDDYRNICIICRKQGEYIFVFFVFLVKKLFIRCC